MRVGIGKIESMKIWKKKIGKYKENWNFGKYEIGNMEKLKNVKDNTNKRENIVWGRGGGQM